MVKSVGNVALEALVVGAGLVALGYVSMKLMNVEIDSKNTKKVLGSIFLAGASFHIICEVTKVNEKYSVDYVEKLALSKISDIKNSIS